MTGMAGDNGIGDGDVASPGRDAAPIRLVVHDDTVTLVPGNGWSAADDGVLRRVAGVRACSPGPGWILPRTRSVARLLKQAFGSRLVVEGPAGAAHEPVSGADQSDASVPDDILEDLRRVTRLRGYARRTETAYVGWVRRFLAFADGQHHDNAVAEAFLDHLARGELAARSRNQAASALTFLFRHVVRQQDEVALPRAKGPQRMPAVLSHGEVVRVLRELPGKYQLIGMLLYSAGLRIGECLSLRIRDINFDLRQILVRDGKGSKDRYVPLAARVAAPLRAQIANTAARHRRDRAAGHGWAPLPDALHRKLPGAGYETGWQFLFPATTINTDPATGHTGRWSLHVSAAEREVKRAVSRAGIARRATCHTLRHSFATETLRSGCDIRTLQSIMGHSDVRTTMIYLHVVEQTGYSVRSPLDRPDDLLDELGDSLPDELGSAD